MYQGTPSATPLYLQRPPLNPPHYGAGFGEAVKRAYSKAFVYEGRASRAEYWWFALFATLVNFPILIVLGSLMNADAPKSIVVLLWLIAFAATVIPAIALCSPPSRHRPIRSILPADTRPFRFDSSSGVPGR